MIPRYDEVQISQIWSEQYKFETYLKVELALLETLEEASRVPVGTAKKIKEKVQIKPERIKEIEATVQHDVIAFCTSITEQIDAQTGRFFHFGATSSDILDTATTLQIQDSLKIILPALQEVCVALKNKANETKDILAMGRSHGMFAEPMSFGQKFLSAYAEFSRRLSDLQNFYDQELTGQFSGAVGNYTILDTQIEEKALKKLGLKVEPISTQVIPRDRLAKLINIHALIGCAIERISVEIRHLHRSDVAEVQEGFSKGQKGSSIMPHKKNPISSENLTGMARILRSHTLLAMENTVLWHERDISHSSTERMYLPDNFGVMLYSLKRLKKTLDNLVIFKENITEKVNRGFAYLSSYYLHFLIEKTEKSREEIYEMVQGCTFQAKSKEEFFNLLEVQLKQKNISISLPSVSSLEKIYMNSTDAVFKRT